MKKTLLILLALGLTSCAASSDWRTASRESAGVAPLPHELNEDIVQLYVARTFGWRRYFAVHPWIAWKKREDSQYHVTHVIGWRVRRGLSAVVVEEDFPDRLWFDEKPQLLYELRGDKARAAIEKMEGLIPNYPYPKKYRAWPGPNSNTYISYLIRHTPELKTELPPHAIGKDWPTTLSPFALSPSGTGVQFSLLGVLGLTVGLQEGIEANILGLNFGVDFWTPALKLPMIGRVGFPQESFPQKDTKE